MNLNGKRVDLPQLQAELATAGVPVPGLGTAGDDLHTYTATGEPTDLPAAAAPVVTAHTPPPIPPTPDYGTDAQPSDQIATAVTNLRNYLALATPTAAQTAAVIRLLCRVALFVLRRVA